MQVNLVNFLTVVLCLWALNDEKKGLKRLALFWKGVYLAYYPPYHSKCNPIERVFGVLEQHWNGSLLDTVQTIINFAKTMTYNGTQPVVKCVERVYQTGRRLTAKQMPSWQSDSKDWPTCQSGL